MRTIVVIAAALWVSTTVPSAFQQAGEDPGRLLQQAQDLEKAGRIRDAVPIAERAVTGYEALGSTAAARLADASLMLGGLYYQLGNVQGAGASFERALSIREKTADAAAISECLTSLANVKRVGGQLVEAEELFGRSVAILEQAFGPSDIRVAETLISYGSLVELRGDTARAEAMLLRARKVYEATGSQATYEFAALLSALGQMYRRGGALERAREPIERSLAIREQLYGIGPPLPPRVATGVASLAALYQEMGQFDLAEPLQRRALAAAEQSAGPSSVPVAAVLTNLAMIRSLRQDRDEAERLLLRALQIREAALGARHADVGSTLEKLAVNYQLSSRRDEALTAMTRATDIVEQNLQLMLSSGSEQQRLNYMGTIRENTDIALSMRQSLFPSDERAASMVAALVLRRKGRVLDAMVTTTERLRKRLTADDAQLLDQLAASRTRLAALVLQPGAAQAKDRDKQTAALTAEIERLEVALSARTREADVEWRPVEARTIQQQLPEDTRLVEFVRYRPFDPQVIGLASRFGKPRYAAFVLSRAGAPRWVELGDAEDIDRQIAGLRAALRSPLRTDVRDRSRDVAKLIFDPLAALVSGATRLVVSPDGQLSVIPFGALVDPDGRYLVERFEMASLASGRDLLRRSTHVAARDAPLIVADPAFSPAGTPVATNGGVVFQSLPGTAQEAAALLSLLPEARVATRADATEALVKAVKGPRVLHIATHGFFFDPLAVDSSPGGDQRGLTAAVPQSESNGRFALLRSGLALSGANERRGGDKEDGLLTALEAASLDLRGTQLVVLSACETGLGEVRSGDGVHGLRRALTLAGAETQVMSLWQVQDEATRDLMISFYRKLMEKHGRAGALRAVQIDWLRKGPRTHPFYWAAFVVTGDWSPLTAN